jgi:hypothetical protein
VTDLLEIKAMVARSRSSAVGAQGPVVGENTQGPISVSIDLSSQFGFGKSREEHSGQFTRPIQSAWDYYDQLLRNFKIQPISR